MAEGPTRAQRRERALTSARLDEQLRKARRLHTPDERPLNDLLTLAADRVEELEALHPEEDTDGTD